MLIVEATNNITIPPRYLNPDGQIRMGAPYSERDFHGPRETLVLDREQDTTVFRLRNQQSIFGRKNIERQENVCSLARPHALVQ